MTPRQPTGTRTRRGAAVATAALLSTVVLVGCTSASAARLDVSRKPFVLSAVTDVKRVAQLTGHDSLNSTSRFEIAGQDLGSMFEADGKTWFVFGDTFGQREAGLTGGGGTEWRSNALAYSSDTDPSDGIRFDGYIADDLGWAKELIDSKKVDGTEMTAIPTYGFEANGAMYLAYMSVKHWGDPGEWETNYAGFARSTDGGQTWTKLEAPRWGGESNFVQVSVSKLDGDLYFWGVTHGRFRGVQLMTVPEKDVENQSAYRYFSGTAADGSPRWSRTASDAKTIVDDTVGELSVVWNDYLSRWIMSYTDGGAESAVLREGATPWGPWGDKLTLASQDEVPGLYAPFLSPNLTANGGRTIYFTLSVWDPYNVYWYRADLVRR